MFPPADKGIQKDGQSACGLAVLCCLPIGTGSFYPAEDFHAQYFHNDTVLIAVICRDLQPVDKGNTVKKCLVFYSAAVFQAQRDGKKQNDDKEDANQAKFFLVNKYPLLLLG